MIKMFEYNPDNRICRINYNFLRLWLPVLCFAWMVTLIVIAFFTNYFALFAALPGAYAGFNLLYYRGKLPKSISIDFKRETMILSTFDGTIVETPVAEVRYVKGSIYYGSEELQSLYFGKVITNNIEVLEGSSELRDFIYKNCKNIGRQK